MTGPSPNRREWLAQALACSFGPAWSPRALLEQNSELHADLVIVGGGLGGCAAALAALRAGCTVILTEPTDWIGGQATAQAVPPDEHPWVEQSSCTKSYREYRDAVRAFYMAHYPLTATARANPRLNPGEGSVSRLCHEPRVSLAVLQHKLSGFMGSRRLRVLLEHVPVRASRNGDRVQAVTLHNADAGEVTVHGAYFLDATELGDLLALTGTEHVVGAESKDQSGEPHASDRAQPRDQQAFTMCFACDYMAGENHRISRPKDYEYWRKYVPELQPSWPGALLAWPYTDPIMLKPKTLAFDPEKATPGMNLWNYRRIAHAAHFIPGSYGSDISLINWPHNDYFVEPLVDGAISAVHAVAAAKQLSLSLLYWLQTDAPRADGGAGWPGLRLREDVVGTADGLAKAPYIRESRRIVAEFTVLEQHIATDSRMAESGKPRDQVTATAFADTVGVGAYRIDLHPSAAGRNFVDLSSLPFQIPLGALLPQRVENLLPACKNIGTTHITNGAYRLHPVEWNIGEAAGNLAAFCLRRKCKPREVRARPELLSQFQDFLRELGVQLEWQNVRPL